MIAVATLAAMAGMYLLVTTRRASASAHGARSAPDAAAKRPARTASDWLRQAGVGDVGVTEFCAVVAGVFLTVSVLAWLVFAGVVAALVAGSMAAAAPIALYRKRRRRLLDQARDSWPYLIEELRLQTGALGRSIPVALFEVGAKAPTRPMREAFEAAHREWLLSTDFARACRVLKAGLADPTADVICETLLVAHDLGGTDLEKRLHALVEDRRTDLRHRHEAVSRQAGARFARWFVIIVPLGMALIGLTIGNGRTAYQSTRGQVSVVIGLLLMGACWLWANSIMRLPEQQRVVDR
jgi:tight adherence protein B